MLYSLLAKLRHFLAVFKLVFRIHAGGRMWCSRLHYHLVRLLLGSYSELTRDKFLPSGMSLYFSPLPPHLCLYLLGYHYWSDMTYISTEKFDVDILLMWLVVMCIIGCAWSPAISDWSLLLADLYQLERVWSTVFCDPPPARAMFPCYQHKPLVTNPLPGTCFAQCSSISWLQCSDGWSVLCDQVRSGYVGILKTTSLMVVLYYKFSH